MTSRYFYYIEVVISPLRRVILKIDSHYIFRIVLILPEMYKRDSLPALLRRGYGYSIRLQITGELKLNKQQYIYFG